MAKINLPELLKTQISLTEWFSKINHEQTEAIRLEDNTRGERIEVLHKVLGLPYDKSIKFPGQVIEKPTKKFAELVKERGHLLCSLRLLPNDPTQQKLRMRGKTLVDAIIWAKEQNVDLSNYTLHVVPHSDQGIFATIFVVNESGIFGEIIEGLPFQLTQGFHETTMAVPFHFDFQRLRIESKKQALKNHINEILGWIVVQDVAIDKTACLNF